MSSVMFQRCYFITFEQSSQSLYLREQCRTSHINTKVWLNSWLFKAETVLKPIIPLFYLFFFLFTSGLNPHDAAESWHVAAPSKTKENLCWMWTFYQTKAGGERFFVLGWWSIFTFLHLGVMSGARRDENEGLLLQKRFFISTDCWVCTGEQFVHK